MLHASITVVIIMGIYVVLLLMQRFAAQHVYERALVVELERRGIEDVLVGLFILDLFVERTPDDR